VTSTVFTSQRIEDFIMVGRALNHDAHGGGQRRRRNPHWRMGRVVSLARGGLLFPGCRENGRDRCTFDRFKTEGAGGATMDKFPMGIPKEKKRVPSGLDGKKAKPPPLSLRLVADTSELSWCFDSEFRAPLGPGMFRHDGFGGQLDWFLSFSMSPTRAHLYEALGEGNSSMYTASRFDRRPLTSAPFWRAFMNGPLKLHEPRFLCLELAPRFSTSARFARATKNRSSRGANGALVDPSSSRDIFPFKFPTGSVLARAF